MSTIAVVTAMAVASRLRAWTPPAGRLWARAAPIGALYPIEALAVLAAAGLGRKLRRLARSRAERSRVESDVDVLAELVLLALSAGLSPASALAAASSFVEPALGSEVAGVLRRGRVEGLAAALREGSGAGAPLYRLMARTVEGGSPLAPALEAFIDEGYDRRRAAAMQRARRLPVKLLFPLTLLILPGFLLLVTVPALSGAAHRIGL